MPTPPSSRGVVPPNASTAGRAPSPYRAAPDRLMADAFGVSFELPTQMRDMSFEQLATHDVSRKQVAMAIGIQDYVNAREGKAVPVRTFIPIEALFTTWKRGPGSATEGHFRAPGYGIPGMIAATTQAGPSSVLASTGPGQGAASLVRSQGQLADSFGVTSMTGQPPRVDPGYIRLRPTTQRNSLPVDASDIVAQARAGSGQDPRGDSAAQDVSMIGRALLFLKGMWNG